MHIYLLDDRHTDFAKVHVAALALLQRYDSDRIVVLLR